MQGAKILVFLETCTTACYLHYSAKKLSGYYKEVLMDLPNCDIAILMIINNSSFKTLSFTMLQPRPSDKSV